MSENPTKAWVCPVCGYVHYGPQPPEECPVCGALGDLFEPAAQAVPEQAVSTPTQTRKVVIVGAGIAGVSAAEALRKAAPQIEITLISNEPDLPYYRLNLTRYLAGEVNVGQLTLHPEGWYAENNIHLLRNSELSAVDLAAKELTFKDGSRIEFDKLILTTGSHPFVPPIPGANRQNVTTLRTRQDADQILAACRGNKKCVCIGGGLLGLETAGALARQGAEVTVLENQAWLLPRQLNETASQLFQAQIQSLGIALHTRAQTRELVGDAAVGGVRLEDGTLIPADLVIISAGVRANVDVARQAGLNVNQGLLVDNTMQTSHPDVFAAGDIAEHQGVLYGIWGPAQMQGTTAGTNAAGQRAEFTGSPRSNTLKVLGVDLFSIGQIAPKDGTDIAIEGVLEGKYFGFIFHDHVMAGAILLGDTTLSAKTKKAIGDRQDCAKVLQGKPDVKDILKFLEECQGC